MSRAPRRALMRALLMRPLHRERLRLGRPLHRHLRPCQPPCLARLSTGGIRLRHLRFRGSQSCLGSGLRVGTSRLLHLGGPPGGSPALLRSRGHRLRLLRNRHSSRHFPPRHSGSRRRPPLARRGDELARTPAVIRSLVHTDRPTPSRRPRRIRRHGRLGSRFALSGGRVSGRSVRKPRLQRHLLNTAADVGGAFLPYVRWRTPNMLRQGLEPTNPE